MSASQNKRLLTRCSCPNLLEWPGGMKAVCRLRYRVSDDLSNDERNEFCENKGYEKCAFYAEQIKQCAEIHSDHYHVIQ